MQNYVPLEKFQADHLNKKENVWNLAHPVMTISLLTHAFGFLSILLENLKY